MERSPQALCTCLLAAHLGYHRWRWSVCAAALVVPGLLWAELGPDAVA
jgi:hypothetical protein